jgi:hypothetical protein
MSASGVAGLAAPEMIGPQQLAYSFPLPHGQLNAVLPSG